ncbi:DUF38 domain-containing protein [Caenorhabditis elegans]|uniref:DUF38 domain-containing protein n=1 Tax=Caenorhabditis elegans TaxID=6239 RepID=A8E0Q0_CAEEL|nr:DUF38 domain-containing protein [Caenorhabditis elegans]CAP09189.1 DUF38 domain-containing protein [Caenorhabditis elegans]|eukprot:NP_001123066.1 Uncharacterized protein CELE_Y70C5A.3 [Caenorhabditis elegans]
MKYVSEYLGSMKNTLPSVIDAAIGYKKTALSLGFGHPSCDIDVYFEDKGSNTLITCPQYHKSFLVEESYFFSVFCDELESMLLRETPLAEFSLSVLEKHIYFRDSSSESLKTGNALLMNLNDAYQWLVNFLRNQGRKLRTTGIFLVVEDASQVLLVLPLVDQNILKFFVISSIYKQGKKSIIDVQEIINLEILNNITGLRIRDCYMSPSTPLQHLFKFPGVSVMMDKVSMNELRGLVKACINNPNCSNFSVDFNEILDTSNKEQLHIPGTGRTINVNTRKVLETSVGEYFIEYFSKTLCIRRLLEKEEKECDIEQNQNESPEPDSSLSQRILQNHLIMEHILGKVGSLTIQTLRKVSHKTRQVVDFLNPDSKIYAIQIHLSDFETVEVKMFFLEGDDIERNIYRSTKVSLKPSFEAITESVKTIYENAKTHKKCCISGNTLDGKELDRFAEELVLNLQNQRSVIQEMCLYASRLPGDGCLNFLPRVYTPEFTLQINEIDTRLENAPDVWKLSASTYYQLLEYSLESLGKLLPVKKLSMQTEHEEDVFKILKNLDPAELNVIEIQKPKSSLIYRSLDINEISILNQWNNAKELLCEPPIAVYQIECLSHFSMIDVHLFTLLLQDMVYLKNKFLSSRTFTKCKIVFEVNDMNENIFEENGLGFAHLRSPSSSGRPSVWFFQYPNNSDLLHILYYEHRSIALSRIPRFKAPDNAVISFS